MFRHTFLELLPSYTFYANTRVLQSKKSKQIVTSSFLKFIFKCLYIGEGIEDPCRSLGEMGKSRR